LVGTSSCHQFAELLLFLNILPVSSSDFACYSFICHFMSEKKYNHAAINSTSEYLSHWILDESPQKKQRRSRKQVGAPKVPNASRRRCKALESPDG
jgi:hypothetical protein